MKKLLVLGAMTLALGITIAACGSSGSSTGGSASTESAEGTGKPYPELHWASASVTRADTVTNFAVPTASLVAPVELNLMTFTSDGKVVPGLAESVDHPDPKTYIYTLKSGEKFSDGKPVTGEDALWSLQRNLGKESQTAGAYESVSSISLKGDNEIVFKLKHPDSAFPNLPAYAGQVMEKAAAIKDGESKIGTSSNLPIGSGPYKFASFNPQQGATLVPNPYWNGEELKAEKIVITWVKDDSALALALRSGEIDGDFFPVARGPFEHIPNVSIMSAPPAIQYAISMNMNIAPFNDVHFRKAVAYATNREGMVSAIFGGFAEINETLTPKPLYVNLGTPAEVEDAFSALPAFEFNLEKAKEELAKSKYPQGATIDFQGGPTNLKIGQILQPDLEKIGIHLKVEDESESEYLEVLFGPRTKQSLFVNSYGTVYPDPSSLLFFFLSPEQATPNGLNTANYKNPKVGELLQEQAEAGDSKERLELLAEIFKITNEEVPYIPVAQPELFAPISSKFVMPEYSQWTSAFGPWPLFVEQAS